MIAESVLRLEVDLSWLFLAILSRIGNDLRPSSFCLSLFEPAELNRLILFLYQGFRVSFTRHCSNQQQVGN
jgi:hypothetical protein